MSDVFGPRDEETSLKEMNLTWTEENTDTQMTVKCTIKHV